MLSLLSLSTHSKIKWINKRCLSCPTELTQLLQLIMPFLTMHPSCFMRHMCDYKSTWIKKIYNIAQGKEPSFTAAETQKPPLKRPLFVNVTYYMWENLDLTVWSFPVKEHAEQTWKKRLCQGTMEDCINPLGHWEDITPVGCKLWLGDFNILTMGVTILSQAFNKMCRYGWSQ